MFGIGNRNRRVSSRRGGAFSGTNLRNAAIAGLGMRAVRWWRNRQAAGPTPPAGAGRRDPVQDNWDLP
jgi:hypothetical protein